MRKQGFTLIELIVAVTIIIFIASTTFIAYNEITVNSRDARRKTDLELLRAALEQYRAKFNTYPIGETMTNRSTCTTNRSSTNPATYGITAVPDGRGNTIGYTQGTNGCILGALVVEGFIDKLPIDPGINGVVDSTLGTNVCNNNQMYAYKDLSSGASYALGAAEEALKNNTGCPTSPSTQYCIYTNNITFSYCVGPVGERDS